MSILQSIQAVSARARVRLGLTSLLSADNLLMQRLPTTLRNYSSANTEPAFIRLKRKVVPKVKPPSGDSCSTCGVEEAPRWYRKPDDHSSLCQRCYYRAWHARNQLNKTCVGCGSQSSLCWHKYSSDPTASLCNKCYRTFFNAQAGWSCVECGSVKTSQWYWHTPGRKAQGDAHICIRCYQRRLMKHVNRQCHECGTSKTIRWLKYPSGGDDTWWCHTCWQRVYRAKKRAVAKEDATQRGG